MLVSDIILLPGAGDGVAPNRRFQSRTHIENQVQMSQLGDICKEQVYCTYVYV